MCGIAGFIDFNKKSTEKDLLAMSQTLFHRGPDGGDFKFFQEPNFTLGLAHRRLAIIDITESGKQPMLFNQHWITFNGEIYNYKEIRSELCALGHSFTSDSDTEVILYAYTQWGEACVERFIGMFAFVIYDIQKNEVFCVRDRAGVKPFFYYLKNGVFLFASELKAFHAHPNFEKKINLDAVAAFMQYGNVPTPHCIFEYTTKLKPGHYTKFSLTQPLNEIKQTQYWSVYNAYNQPKLDISFEEAKKETEKILQSACDYRMVADVPVGVFLSGGYDSTCVTALLQKDRTEPLKTYTIAVPDIGLNEAAFAKETANYLGTKHTEIACTEKEVLEWIPELPFYYDEPFADSSALPTTLVSKVARQEVTVALSADAGDEVFAGYNRYSYLLKYRSKLEQIPGFARKSIAGLMNVIPSNALPILKHKYNFHNRYEKLKGILKDPSEENIMLSLSQQYTDTQMKEVMHASFHRLKTAYQSKELAAQYYSPLAYMQAVDYQTYLVDDILQKVDRATMTVSLEGREPFLDHRVIEWAARLPNDYKLHQGNQKYILKEIVHQYVPKEMMDRPKMGFAIPIAKWLATDLRPLVETYINEEKIESQDIFNWEHVSKLKQDFLGGKKELDYKIWYLLMFQMWYEKWMH